jgi:hypothetical protein
MCEILCHIIPAQSLRRMEESGHIRILSPAGPETTANGLNIALESRDLFKSTGAKTSSERKIADVTAMAVELLAKQSGLEEYIYGIVRISQSCW